MKNVKLFEEFINEASNIKISGKKVDIDTIEIDGVDTDAGPDDGTVDAFIAHAEFENGKKLNDRELDKLNDDYADLIYDLAIQQYF